LIKRPKLQHLKLVKFLLWDATHADKGKHSKFQKLWIGPYITAAVVGQNSYLLSDEELRLLEYVTNGSHLKHYYDLSCDHNNV